MKISKFAIGIFVILNLTHQILYQLYQWIGLFMWYLYIHKYIYGTLGTETQ